MLMVTSPSQRHIPFEGCFNFRDLGGYCMGDGRRVAWGRLFRSAALHRMTASDAALARGEIGLATVFDLRSAVEAHADGLGLLGAAPIVYRRVPLVANVQRLPSEDGRRSVLGMAQHYLRILAESGPQIALVLEALADPMTYPAVFHCAAGKDRTGVLAAVVLDILGVSDEDIIRDYVLTNRSIDLVIEQLRTAPVYSQVLRDVPREFFHVVPETMATFLSIARRQYGSMTRYVEAEGVASDVLRRLEDQLLA